MGECGKRIYHRFGGVRVRRKSSFWLRSDRWSNSLDILEKGSKPAPSNEREEKSLRENQHNRYFTIVKARPDPRLSLPVKDSAASLQSPYIRIVKLLLHLRITRRLRKKKKYLTQRTKTVKKICKSIVTKSIKFTKLVH